VAKPKITKEQAKEGTAQWFWLKMEKQQSNVMLRRLEKIDSLPSGVDPEDVLKACMKGDMKWRHGGGVRPRVTTVDEKILLKLLGTGKLSDDRIRDVLLFASPYAIMSLNKKRPDLLPADQVEKHIREEADVLVDLHFVKKRRNDRQLLAFIRWLERIPGFTEIVTVHQVHAL
jgi:hypothetical protein